MKANVIVHSITVQALLWIYVRSPVYILGIHMIEVTRLSQYYDIYDT